MNKCEFFIISDDEITLNFPESMFEHLNPVNGNPDYIRIGEIIVLFIDANHYKQNGLIMFNDETRMYEVRVEIYD